MKRISETWKQQRQRFSKHTSRVEGEQTTAFNFSDEGASSVENCDGEWLTTSTAKETNKRRRKSKSSAASAQTDVSRPTAIRFQGNLESKDGIPFQKSAKFGKRREKRSSFEPLGFSGEWDEDLFMDMDNNRVLAKKKEKEMPILKTSCKLDHQAFAAPHLQGSLISTPVNTSVSCDFIQNDLSPVFGPEANVCQKNIKGELRSTQTSARRNQGSSNLKGLSRMENDEKLSLDSWSLPSTVLHHYKDIGISHMFQWQAECLLTGKSLEGGNLVYSAPTSAGKTLVAEILMLKRILETGRKAIYILPFVSVAKEKTYYLQKLYEEVGIRVEGFVGSQAPAGGFAVTDVAVCTIEKANSLTNRLIEEQKISELGCIIVDEMHMIGDPGRGYLLELLLSKVTFLTSDPTQTETRSTPNDSRIQIIGMSATLPNLPMLASWLKADLYVTDFRPVPLTEMIKVGKRLIDVEGKSVGEIKSGDTVHGDEEHVLPLCLETLSAGNSVLIFCPAKNWCEKLAETLARLMGDGNHQTVSILYGETLDAQPGSLYDSNTCMEVVQQLRGTPVGLDSVLEKVVPRAVAFHHAGLTSDEREIIEGAFRNGAIKILIATSTLSSGVNLPARRVIIRTPMFYGKLLDALVYKQMSGRAGRKGKDVQGESVLICKESEKQKGMSLITSHLKPVYSCLLGEKGSKGLSSMKRALLEIVGGNIANTHEQIQRYAACTYLHVCIGEIADCDPDVAVKSTIEFLVENEFIALRSKGNEVQGETKEGNFYFPTQLGKATLASALAPTEALVVFRELQTARRCFVLENELHVIYQVTPIYLQDQFLDLNWYKYMSMWEKLPPQFKRVGDVVGIKEGFLARAAHNRVSMRTEEQRRLAAIHRRFYAALLLQDLVNELSIPNVCRKYGINKGLVQSLQGSAATFAGMVTVFCQKLGWLNLELILQQFQSRLSFGISRELCDLVRISLLNGARARLLYNSGYHTVNAVATSSPVDIGTLLMNAAPFESTKGVSGETRNEVFARKRARSIWVTGQDGLTEMEAAELIVKEARRIVEKDIRAMGVDTAGFMAKALPVIPITTNTQAASAPYLVPVTSQVSVVPGPSASLHGDKRSDLNARTAHGINEAMPVNHRRFTGTKRKSPDAREPQQQARQREELTHKIGHSSPKQKRTDISGLRNNTGDREGESPLRNASIRDDGSAPEKIRETRAHTKEDLISEGKVILSRKDTGEKSKRADVNGAKGTNTRESSMYSSFPDFIDGNVSVDTPVPEKRDSLHANVKETKANSAFSVVTRGSMGQLPQTKYSCLMQTEPDPPLNRKGDGEQTHQDSNGDDAPQPLDVSSSLFSSIDLYSPDQPLITEKGNTHSSRCSCSTGEFDFDESLSILRTQNGSLDRSMECHNLTPELYSQSPERQSNELVEVTDCQAVGSQALALRSNSIQDTSAVKTFYSSRPMSGTDASQGEEEAPFCLVLSDSESVEGSEKLAEDPDKFDRIRSATGREGAASPEFLPPQSAKSNNKHSDSLVSLEFDSLEPMIDQLHSQLGNLRRRSAESIANLLEKQSPDNQTVPIHNTPATAGTDDQIASIVSSGTKNMSRRHSALHSSFCTPGPCEFVVIDVTCHQELFHTFIKEWNEQDTFAFAVACESKAKETSTIGSRVMNSKTKLSPIIPRGIPSPDNNYDIIGIAVSWEARDAYFISLEEKPPLQSIPGDDQQGESTSPSKLDSRITLESRLQIVKSVFQRKGTHKTAFDFKSQYKCLCQCCNVAIQETIKDPRVAAWLLDPGDKVQSFSTLVRRFLGEDDEELISVIGNLPGHGSPALTCQSSTSARVRACVEAVLSQKLMQVLEKQMVEDDLSEAFFKIEMPILLPLAHMEMAGIGFSSTECGKLKSVLKQKLSSLEKSCYHLVGRSFSLTSPEEVSRVLYFDLKLPYEGMTDRHALSRLAGRALGRKLRHLSTAKAALEKIRTLHPLPDLILEWRRVNNALIKVVFPLFRRKQFKPELNMDRIYSESQTQTATGRVSFVEPNLQNVPRDFDINLDDPAKVSLQTLGEDAQRRLRRMSGATMASTNNAGVSETAGSEANLTGQPYSISMRTAFVPFANGVFLAADYSQMELRLIAHLSQDEKLMRILNNKGDVFRLIAGEIFSTTADKVDSKQRQAAKHICYGIIYGIGAKALGQQLSLSESEAQQYMNKFMTKFLGIRVFIKKIVEKAKKNGYVTTLMKRRRYLAAINSTNSHARAHAERQAVNTTVQGSAADITKRAMINIRNALNKVVGLGAGNDAELCVSDRVNLVLQLHDELLYEVDRKMLPAVAKIVKHEMENAIQLDVVMPVKLVSGNSWGTLLPYT